MHSIKNWNLILNCFLKILQENAIGELEVVLIIIEKIHKSNKLVRQERMRMRGVKRGMQGNGFCFIS